MKLFGEISIFQLLVSWVAFGTGIFTFWKHYLQRPHVDLYPGASVKLLHPSGIGAYGDSAHIWISGVIANRTSRGAVVYPITGTLKAPYNVSYTAKWTRFITELPSGRSYSSAHAIFVPPNSSTSFYIEFQIDPTETLPAGWIDGNYRFELNAWLQKRDESHKHMP